MNDEVKPLVGSGATTMSLTARDGKVILQFPHAIEWAAFTPEVAVNVAKQMLDACVNCGVDLVVDVPRQEISMVKRNHMASRIKMILLNKRSAAESTDILSARLVDTILNMIE